MHNTKLISKNYISDPNSATSVISHLNGWSSNLAHVPDDFIQCWGVIITMWENSESIGSLTEKRVQTLLYKDKSISRHYEVSWNEWGKS